MSPFFNRRQFVRTAAALATLPVIRSATASSSDTGSASSAFAPPASPRAVFNFDLGWKFLREDAAGAERLDFDDARWIQVSTPHTFNDVDSFRQLISHGGGDRGTYKGIGWYRKLFTLPANVNDPNIFLEFEGMRQAGLIYLNGKEIGLYENGVTSYGVDITSTALRNGQPNLLAIKLDNRTTYAEASSGTTFEWNANDFNPDFGGINRHVRLHVVGSIYQTLPLYDGLKTQGIYVYAENFDLHGQSADVTVESEVRNASHDRASVSLAIFAIDADGNIALQVESDPVDMVAGETSVLSATGRMAKARFWNPSRPHLYEVYSLLKVDGAIVDAQTTVTGFRKTAFRGGAGTGGVYINDQFVYLKGFAQRSTNEWAGLGQAYPDWMHDYNGDLMRQSHANYVRWMHVAPQRVDVETMDRSGIIQICPAGDKESDTTGRQWEQRIDVMRSTIISYRNSPSVLFWEAGNTVITPHHMEQMIALRKQWDPHGGRATGNRGNDNNAANSALTPIAEYYGVMIGQAPQTDALTSPTDIFRGYSAQRRDRAPLIEAEDFREECARRFWDKDSPPYFGFKKGPNDTWSFNSDTFALAGIKRFWEYQQNCISNPDKAHSKWSGYASIYFSDSDADGRQDSSEVCRVSGKVDAVRLPKDLYFAHRVMQNAQPDLHILGHWSYPLPPAAKTIKTVYVIANVEAVELFLGHRSLGVNRTPASGFIFAFPDIEFIPGILRAEGRNHGRVVARQQLPTSGPAASIRLTALTGPLGLQATGQDVALIDVEVVDAKGARVPCDDARIDFAITGPGIWRGGYNSGRLDSTNNLYLNSECGINRVAVRSTRAAGLISVTASRVGLRSSTVSIPASAVPLTGGLTTWVPPRLPIVRL